MNEKAIRTLKERLATRIGCDPDMLMTRREVAEQVLYVSIGTIASWHNRYVAPKCYVEGRNVFYLPEDIIAWEANCPLQTVGARVRKLKEEK